MMIDEIEYPLPTIQEHRDRVNLTKRLRKKYGTGSSEYDVSIKTDRTIITELSEKCDIDEELAERLLVVFFEEIKKCMVNGIVLIIENFGKFYVCGLNRNNNRKLSLPSNRSPIIPSFKANRLYKNSIYKKSLK